MLLGRSEAAALGLDALPLPLIAHPLAGLTREQVMERAASVVAEVRYILTTPSDRLAADYRGRQYSQPQQVFHGEGQISDVCRDPISCGKL